MVMSCAKMVLTELRGRVEEVHVAGGLVGVVVHGPGHAVGRAGRVGDGQYRRAREGGVERDALVDRGREHERLEGAAGGAPALGGEVELELASAGEVAEHRLDRACTWVDGDQRRRRVGRVHERARDRGACVVLHPRVERRAYPESAGFDAPRAEGVHELLLCPAEEVRVPHRAVQPSRPEAERRGRRPACTAAVRCRRWRASPQAPRRDDRARPRDDGTGRTPSAPAAGRREARPAASSASPRRSRRTSARPPAHRRRARRRTPRSGTRRGSASLSSAGRVSPPGRPLSACATTSACVLPMYRLRTSSCVIVEPPSTILPARTSW